MDDGVVAARVTAVSGVMDLGERKLIGGPAEYFRALAGDGEVLGV